MTPITMKSSASAAPAGQRTSTGQSPRSDSSRTGSTTTPRGFAVAWHDQNPDAVDDGAHLWLSRLSLDGVVLGAPRSMRYLGSRIFDLDLVWRDGAYTLIWDRNLLLGDPDSTAPDAWLHAQRVDGDGRPVDDACVVRESRGSLWGERVVATDSGLALAWSEYLWNGYAPSIHLTRLAPDGSPGAVSIVEGIANRGRPLGLAFTGRELTIAWNDRHEDSDVIRVTRASLDGERLDRSVVARDAHPRIGPALAWSGDGFGLAWRGADGATMFRTLTREGHALGPPRRLATPAESPEGQKRPDTVTP